VDFDDLDVFGVEDINDLGGNEPLFKEFTFEDWAMMNLRFELHLLTHAFRRDADDPERTGIHVDHLGFYYKKYFKKELAPTAYGVETCRELLQMVKDTVYVTKVQIIESQLPEELESLGMFVKLVEESRRYRKFRIDLGEESARLRLRQPASPQTAVPAAAHHIKGGCVKGYGPYDKGGKGPGDKGRGGDGMQEQRPQKGGGVYGQGGKLFAGVPSVVRPQPWYTQGGKGASDKGKDGVEEQRPQKGGGGSGKGVCYNFLRGNCYRGNSCRYSHDVQPQGGKPAAGGPSIVPPQPWHAQASMIANLLGPKRAA